MLFFLLFNICFDTDMRWTWCRVWVFLVLLVWCLIFSWSLTNKCRWRWTFFSVSAMLVTANLPTLRFRWEQSYCCNTFIVVLVKSLNCSWVKNKKITLYFVYFGIKNGVMENSVAGEWAIFAVIRAAVKFFILF